jgi:hypothetical protein
MPLSTTSPRPGSVSEASSAALCFRGRPKVIAAESAVAAVFVLVAAAAVSGPAWLLVAGLAGHGVKDFWQHRTRFVTGTRWWPPFCAAVDWVAAAILAVALAAGADLR